ncbi:hypothetical protein BH10ACT1_BH10ACT1_05220 [soil metagenome]
MTDEDLTWLTSQRPSPAPVDAAGTGRARTALLDHASPPEATITRIEDARTTRAPRPARRSARYVAMAGAAAVALVVGLTVSGGSNPEPASAAPLATLSAKVEQSPAPSGDATLVVRTQTPAGEPSMTGHDLYLDDGRYFYGETSDQLGEAIASGGEQDGGMARIRKAATDALDLPIDQARSRMADAAQDPDAASADPALADPATEEKGHPLEPMDPALHLESMVWSNSLDALVSGSGRPEVRAGVLRLLAGSKHVDVANGEHEGRPTLVLTARVFPDAYQEQLTIDARTGVPVDFVGSTAGQPPSVTIGYQVSRVTVADLSPG